MAWFNRKKFGKIPKAFVSSKGAGEQYLTITSTTDTETAGTISTAEPEEFFASLDFDCLFDPEKNDMKGSFTKRGRRCDVTVTKTHLKCVLKVNIGPNVFLTISLDDVLAVETQSRDNGSTNTVIVHYAAPKKHNILTWSRLVLSGEPELCKELNQLFATAIADRLRPKQYYVIINPVSGNKTASQVFHKKIAPLFTACGSTFRVYETQGKDDYDNALKDVDLSELDGLISVGGDGHYSNLVTAAIKKQNALSGNDINDPETSLSPLPCPIGIVPAGTGNYVANYLHGTKDLMTSAIKIVLGASSPSNVVSVHQGNKLVGCGGLICAYGLFGDMMERCERNRWMGNLRYMVMPVRTILARRLIPDLHIDIQRESNPGKWDTITGSYYSVNTHVVHLSDNGSKLVPVFGDSALTINITSTCRLGDHIKQLSKVAAWDTGAFNFDFVREERVLRYRLRLPNSPTVTSQSGETTLSDSYYINLDGEPELINKPVCDIRLHPGVVKLFGSSSPIQSQFL